MKKLISLVLIMLLAAGCALTAQAEVTALTLSAPTGAPALAVAVIMTEPRLMPVTVPFWDTVAMLSSEEDQDMAEIVASSGVTREVRGS